MTTSLLLTDLHLQGDRALSMPEQEIRGATKSVWGTREKWGKTDRKLYTFKQMKQYIL